MTDIDRGMFGLVGATALMLPAPVVVAAEYLTIDVAQKEFFPQAQSFDPVLLSLTPEQKSAVAKLAGPQPPHGNLRIWGAIANGINVGYVFFDEVIGKSDYITYATAIDANGALRTVEILSYRESHGAEIRNTAWRQQFANKSDLAQLRFRIDIKNISGATLSAEHVTQGVRWIYALWQTALRAPNPQ
jgi:Na+-translocating ferredoxin:NAD+ oxidoreductase RnfG subunit